MSGYNKYIFFVILTSLYRLESSDLEFEREKARTERNDARSARLVDEAERSIERMHLLLDEQEQQSNAHRARLRRNAVKRKVNLVFVVIATIASRLARREDYPVASTTISWGAAFIFLNLLGKYFRV